MESNIQIYQIVVGPVHTNCYVFHLNDSKNCILVDPGEDVDKIKELIDRKELKPEAILLTHGHFDHIMAVNELTASYRCPVYACDKEEKVLGDCMLNCSRHGAGVPYTVKADRLLKDGEKVSLAGMEIQLLHTPGHTGGSCCYYVNESVCFSGDTLFYESIGRTDLPTGNDMIIADSIIDKILVLNEDTVVYPGHGFRTTVEYEKKNNPYVN